MSPSELLRRLVHIGIGLGAYLVPVIGVDAATVLALAAIPANAWLLPRLPWVRRVIRPDGKGTHALWLYPLSVAALLLAFRGTPEVAQCGWLALGVGDGLAPFIAMVIRGPTWRFNGTKRVFVSVLAGMVAGLACWPVVGARGAVAVAAAGAVADSLPLEDNVTWPWATAIAA